MFVTTKQADALIAIPISHRSADDQARIDFWFSIEADTEADDFDGQAE